VQPRGSTLDCSLPPTEIQPVPGVPGFKASISRRCQTDGYAAYDGVGGAGLVHAACWAHARRKFFEAVKLNPDDRAAIAVVAAMDALFGLDREAAGLGLDRAGRHALRKRKAPALLAGIRAAVEAAGAAALPASALGRAARYTLALCHKRTRFLEHPVLELSNNLAENSMRPLAPGPQELDPHRQSPGRAPRRCHPLGGRKLPPP